MRVGVSSLSCVVAWIVLPPLLLFGQNAEVDAHERSAHEYLQARQPEKALKEFGAVVALDPNNLDAQANLGVLLYFSGEVATAASHLRAALKLDASQAKLQALLGFCERRTGELQAARADLGAAFPRLEDLKIRKQAGLELVELDTAVNDLPAAAAVLAQLRTALATDPEVLYAAYRVNTDLANEALLDLSLAAPDSGQLHQAIAHELLRDHDNAGAIANLRAALKSNPHLPGAHFELGEILRASSDPTQKAESKDQYALALQENPKDDKALAAVGDLLAEGGDHSGAIDRFKQALSVQPGNIDALVGLAHELVDTGHPEAALPVLLQAEQQDSENILVHFRLSALYRRLHRLEDSKHEVSEYERLKEIQDKLGALYKNLRFHAGSIDETDQ